MTYDLPTSVEVGGVSYEIRSDYRAVLDLCTALSDAELSDQDKGIVSLDIFYPAFSGYTVERDGVEEAILMPPEHYEDAIKRCFWFISCGDEGQNRKGPKLMDWEQDFKHIVSPINRVIGTEVRALEYLHWWTFIGAYHEMGDCTFAQVIRVRDCLSRGKSLDKQDREWYSKNREIVDLRAAYSEGEKAVLSAWGI